MRPSNPTPAPMSNPRFVPIAPASLGQVTKRPSPEGSHKGIERTPRTETLIACASCRKKKQKCDGKRPVCTRCVGKNFECLYDTNSNGTTRAQANKQRIDELQQQNEQYRSLLDHFLSPSSEEAHNALRVLRKKRDFASTLEALEQSALLLQLARGGEDRIQGVAHRMANPSFNSPASNLGSHDSSDTLTALVERQSSSKLSFHIDSENSAKPKLVNQPSISLADGELSTPALYPITSLDDLRKKRHLPSSAKEQTTSSSKQHTLL